MAPGAFGPMPAKLAERAGFDAVYVPGGGIALARLGIADIGLVTMTEMVDSAGAIARSVSVPVIADADTGFGNQLNAQRAVREYERAGIAAIHIEDQTFPKKCGQFDRKTLIPLDEAASKIRAAVSARTDPDFVIIARCDALSVAGMDEVVRRCAAYREAGADMIFVESPRSLEEIAAIPRLIPGAHMFNMSASGKTPALSADDLTRLGYRMMILPNFSGLVAIKAIGELFATIHASGSVAGVLDRCATFREFTDLGDLAAFEAVERQFGTGQPT